MNEPKLLENGNYQNKIRSSKNKSGDSKILMTCRMNGTKSEKRKEMNETKSVTVVYCKLHDQDITDKDIIGEESAIRVIASGICSFF